VVAGVPDFTRRSWQEQRTDAQLTVSILDGKGTVMPAFHGRLREAQVKSLVAHIRAFAQARSPAPAATTSAPPAPRDDFDAQFRRLQEEFNRLKWQMKELEAASSRDDQRAAERPVGTGEGIEAVGSLYQQLCQRCHGANGKGAPEKTGLEERPDFSRRAWQKRRSDAQLLASILDGTKGGMPAFRDRLTEAQAQALISHIRGFAPERPK
jgi:mono/diheme cytochrome c family protein